MEAGSTQATSQLLVKAQLALERQGNPAAAYLFDATKGTMWQRCKWNLTDGRTTGAVQSIEKGAPVM